MSSTTHTLSDRLSIVAACVSTESLTAVYARNTPLPEHAGVPTEAHITESLTRVHVRESIASHPLCSAPLRKLLATDTARSVRRTVAATVSDGTVLNLLATDCEATVKEAVCSNLATPAYLLRVLSADNDPLVRLSAMTALQGDTTSSPLFAETGSFVITDCQEVESFMPELMVLVA